MGKFASAGAFASEVLTGIKTISSLRAEMWAVKRMRVLRFFYCLLLLVSVQHCSIIGHCDSALKCSGLKSYELIAR